MFEDVVGPGRGEVAVSDDDAWVDSAWAEFVLTEEELAGLGDPAAFDDEQERRAQDASPVLDLLGKAEAEGWDGWALGALARRDPGEFSPFEQVEAARMWAQLEARAAAQKLAAIAAYTAEVPTFDIDGPRFPWAELAPALGIGIGTASQLVGLSWDLAHRLPATRAALETGLITQAKAQAISEETAWLSDENAAKAEQIVLAQREVVALSAGVLRRRIGRIAARLDPAGHRERHKQARQDVRLVITQHPDGVGELFVRMDAVSVQMIWTAADAYARRFKAAGDKRKLETLRVAALVDWASQFLTTGRIVPIDQDCEAPAPADSSAAVLFPADDPGAQPPAAVPVLDGAELHAALARVRAAAGDLSWPLLRDLREPNADDPDEAECSGGEAEGCGGEAECREAEGCGSEAKGCGGEAECREAEGCGGEIGAEWDGVLSVPVRQGRPITLNLTMPIEAFIGAADNPAELGNGDAFIPAEQARRLVDGGWVRRLMYTEVNGALVEVSDRYRPPAAMAEAVCLRDGMPMVPTGSTADPAAGDLDHLTPYADGGPTTAVKLKPFTRRWHNVKTHGQHDPNGWRVDGNPDGSVTWTSPQGRRYTVYPYDYRNGP